MKKEVNILKQAKEFAMEAHKNQVRKSDIEKPMILHPIDVAMKLTDYGFDDEVIAAAYLHDVVEDTKYEMEDIEKNFGKNIASLVKSATEPDKSLSWEERKQHTINNTKDLDLRHKAIICADKISNLEDIRTLYEIKGDYDFSAFKRGFDSQKWYYEEIYKSLINNQDEELPMFKRLKELIDYVFEDNRDDEFIKNTIFKSKEKEYKEIKKIHYKKEEVFKMKKLLPNSSPYVIEFTGTPRTGKTSLINNLKDFFKKKGFKVEVLEEFTTSKKYKEEIYPHLKDKYKSVVNTEIPKYVLKQLEDSLSNNPDIIIIDRSLVDRMIWIERLYKKQGLTDEEYKDYNEYYIPKIKEKINITLATFADSETSLKRDYKANLSLEKRSFLNKDNVDEYNDGLLSVKKICKKENINFHMFNTSKKKERQISIEVANCILDDMKKTLLDQIHKEYK